MMGWWWWGHLSSKKRREWGSSLTHTGREREHNETLSVHECSAHWIQTKRGKIAEGTMEEVCYTCVCVCAQYG